MRMKPTNISSNRRWLLWLYAAVLVSLLLLAWTGWLLWKSLKRDQTPSFSAVRHQYCRTDALLLDRQGEILHRLRVDPHGRRLDWAPLDAVSPALVTAVIHAEDRHFYQHRGVDWRALSKAGFKGLEVGNWRGASTITMQLASRLSPKLQPQRNRRTVVQKFTQLLKSLSLEKSLSKNEVLEAYLNLVTFRGELQGITAASLGLFGKRPHGLNPVESVILASLIRSPNAPAGEVAVRSAWLATSLNWKMDSSKIAESATRHLRGPYRVPLEANWAPHLATQLLKPLAGSKNDSSLQIICTLDGSLQRFAGETLRQHLISVHSRHVNDGAVLVVDNPSGEVLAYVGSAGDLSSAPQVDGIQALRQAGSILKPFLYGLAFERHILTASSLLEDRPLKIGLLNGVYWPENYDRQYRGLVTVRTALAASLNVPAVKVLNLVGVEPFVEELSRLGFREMRNPDYYGPSLALGAVDIALWDLVNAYRSLANCGLWQPLYLIPEKVRARAEALKSDHAPSSVEEGSRRILSRATAFILADVLSDRESRSSTFSLESPLATRFWTAVKTGTSKDMRDNWCVGFSSRYTVGVWVGNFSGEPMWNVMGITGAAPVWVDIMNWLHRHFHSSPPVAPSILRAQQTTFPDLSIDRSEWYLPGTEVTVTQAASVGVSPKIISPADGEVIAWDPDIPAGQQRLFLEAQPRSEQLHWELDGAGLGPAGALQSWALQPGKHWLKLVTPTGEILDTVQFHVRGGPTLASWSR
jgi:penicillin-binding protein 1C